MCGWRTERVVLTEVSERCGVSTVNHLIKEQGKVFSGIVQACEKRK